MSLLDEAKKIQMSRSRNQWNEEHFELTKAWLEWEISLTQIAKVITIKGKHAYPNNAANMVMYCLRDMRRKGLIQVKENVGH